jgi:hypothetical protein
MKCTICETPCAEKFCADCTKNLTYFERLLLVRLTDIGFCLFEMNDKMKNQKGW